MMSSAAASVVVVGGFVVLNSSDATEGAPTPTVVAEANTSETEGDIGVPPTTVEVADDGDEPDEPVVVATTSTTLQSTTTIPSTTVPPTTVPTAVSPISSGPATTTTTSSTTTTTTVAATTTTTAPPTTTTTTTTATLPPTPPEIRNAYSGKGEVLLPSECNTSVFVTVDIFDANNDEMTLDLTWSSVDPSGNATRTYKGLGNGSHRVFLGEFDYTFRYVTIYVTMTLADNGNLQANRGFQLNGSPGGNCPSVFG